MKRKFQFTRPQGARQLIPKKTLGDGVSIHAPARGAAILKILSVEDGSFQFTRPQGARRREFRVRFGWRVSIHAPARGAA